MAERPHSQMRAVDWAAAAGIALLLAVAGYLSIGMGIGRMRQLHLEEQQLAQELATLTEASNVVMTAEATLAELDAQREALARRMPRSLDFSNFYGSLTEAAEAAEVVLSGVEPGAVTQAPEYLALPIRLQAQGQFAALYEFVFHLTHVPRLIKVQRLQVKATEDPGTCALDMEVTVFASLPGAAA